MMKFILRIFYFAILFSSVTTAKAGVFELGGSYAYQHSTYNGGSYTWSKRWTASLGYYFTQDSELEFMYQDSTNEDYSPNIQDINYHDRVYSLNMNYYLFGQANDIKPFVRLGVGQLNRDATGWYAGGYQAPGRLDQVTVILGGGVKVKISSEFALKADATTYLLNGAISTWSDNLALSIGGSYYF